MRNGPDHPNGVKMRSRPCETNDGLSSGALLQWAYTYTCGVEELPAAVGASHKACLTPRSEELDLDRAFSFLL